MGHCVSLLRWWDSTLSQFGGPALIDCQSTKGFHPLKMPLGGSFGFFFLCDCDLVEEEEAGFGFLSFTGTCLLWPWLPLSMLGSAKSNRYLSLSESKASLLFPKGTSFITGYPPTSFKSRWTEDPLPTKQYLG